MYNDHTKLHQAVTSPYHTVSHKLNHAMPFQMILLNNDDNDGDDDDDDDDNDGDDDDVDNDDDDGRARLNWLPLQRECRC